MLAAMRQDVNQAELKHRSGAGGRWSALGGAEWPSQLTDVLERCDLDYPEWSAARPNVPRAGPPC